MRQEDEKAYTLKFRMLLVLSGADCWEYVLSFPSPRYLGHAICLHAPSAPEHEPTEGYQESPISLASGIYLESY